MHACQPPVLVSLFIIFDVAHHRACKKRSGSISRAGINGECILFINVAAESKRRDLLTQLKMSLVSSLLESGCGE